MDKTQTWTHWASPTPVPKSAPAAAQQVTDDTRRMIAQRLLQLATIEDVVRDLVQQGFSEDTARAEIAQATRHPYLLAGMGLATKLKKREWILENYRKLDDLSLTSGIVERRHRLSQDEFLQNYYTTNRPVVITGMMDDWAAMKKWTPAYLRERYGHLTVEVQANRNADRNYETNMQLLKRDMLFADFLDLITAAGATNDVYMTANNTSKNSETLQEMWDDIDGLPEYLDTNRPERGFLWIGPTGTITPLHHDLTNNFMAQVVGRKHVKIISACHAAYVYNHLHCYSEVDMTDIDYERFPLMRDAKVLDVTLEPGEVLFLPIGCWHYVRGLDISITMSFINFRFDNDFSSYYKTYHEI